MDIEGSEYEILDQLASANSSFSGIAVELHSFDEAHLEYADLFSDLHRYFKVAHVHVNNSGPLDSRGCPTVVEVSYIHNRLVASQAQAPAWQADNKLDQPNCLKLPDFQVHFRAA